MKAAEKSKKKPSNLRKKREKMGKENLESLLDGDDEENLDAELAVSTEDTLKEITKCGFVLKKNSDASHNVMNILTEERCDVEKIKGDEDCPTLKKLFEECVAAKPEVELGVETEPVEGEGDSKLNVKVGEGEDGEDAKSKLELEKGEEGEEDDKKAGLEFEKGEEEAELDAAKSAMEDSLNKIPPLPGSDDALANQGIEKEKSEDEKIAEDLAKAVTEPQSAADDLLAGKDKEEEAAKEAEIKADEEIEKAEESGEEMTTAEEEDLKKKMVEEAEKKLESDE